MKQLFIFIFIYFYIYFFCILYLYLFFPVEILSNTCLYNLIRSLFQLLDLFTCRKLANLSQNFVTETCKQHPKTTRRRLCCKKLVTSHDVEGFAIGSFLERIVVERANDDLCQKNVKKAGLISAKPIDLQRNLP